MRSPLQKFRQRNKPGGENTHVNFDRDVNNNIRTITDSFNELNFSPPPPASPATNISEAAAKSTKYWIQNFFVVLIPFAVIGLPIHILLSSRNRDGEKVWEEEVNENTWAYWFKFRFQTKVSGALTIILLPWCLLFNGYGLWRVYMIFENLVIKGALTDQDISNAMAIVYISPVLGIMNYAWMYGHSLNRLIRAFGRPVLVTAPPTQSAAGNSIQKTLSINEGNHQSYRAESNAIGFELITEPCELPHGSGLRGSSVVSIITETKGSNFRLNLFKAYILIFSAYILHYLITQHRTKVEGWSAKKVRRHWTNYAYAVTYTLILPVYSCFCGAVLCRLQSLNGFIARMIDRGERMELVHVYLLKKAYKIVADSIVQVNSFCRIPLACVLIILYYSAGMSASELLVFLARRIFRAFNELTETESSQTEAPMDIAMTPRLGSDDLGVPPDVVRFYVGTGVEALLYIYLMRSTVWDAINVNDECRYLGVRLNDLATEIASASSITHVGNFRTTGKEHFVDPDTYRAFKLLKLYIHSRMEAKAEDQIALLSILEIIMILPGMPLISRISGYNLIH